jgi:hypothetical protein
VLLQFIQYSCQNLCTLECNGLCRAMRTPVHRCRRAGITTSDHQLRSARDHGAGVAEKHNYESQINKDGVADAWHFLTGTQDSIRK